MFLKIIYLFGNCPGLNITNITSHMVPWCISCRSYSTCPRSTAGHITYGTIMMGLMLALIYFWGGRLHQMGNWTFP